MPVASLPNLNSIQAPAPRRSLQEASLDKLPVHTNTDCYQPGSAWFDTSSPEVVVFQLPSANAESVSAQTFAVPSQKAPVLDRPVILVHGLNAEASTWENMHTWFVGSNADGGVVGPGTGAIDPKAKVFEAEFSRPYNGIKKNASELQASIDKICKATGATQVDVVGHSLGGLDTRYLLDQGYKKINHLVMVATPNHGSALGDADLAFREMGVPIKPSVDDAEVRQCFRDLCEDRKTDSGQNNPVVHDLNAHIDRQKAHAKMFVIAGNGTPTLKSKTILTVRGDGAVPQSSAKLDGVPIKNVWWTTHGSVKEHPDTLLATAAFITDKPVDMRDAEPTGVPEDKNITPLQITSTPSELHYLVQENKG